MSSLSCSSIMYSMSPFSGANKFLHVTPTQIQSQNYKFQLKKFKNFSYYKKNSFIYIITNAYRLNSAPISISVANSMRISPEFIAFHTRILNFIAIHKCSSMYPSSWKVSWISAFYFCHTKKN